MRLDHAEDPPPTPPETEGLTPRKHSAERDGPDPRRQLAAELNVFAVRYLRTSEDIPTVHLCKEEMLFESIKRYADEASLPVPLDVSLYWNSGSTTVMGGFLHMEAYDGDMRYRKHLPFGKTFGNKLRNVLIRHLDKWLIYLVGESTLIPLHPNPPDPPFRSFCKLPNWQKDCPQKDAVRLCFRCENHAPPVYRVNWKQECTLPRWDVCRAAMMVCSEEFPPYKDHFHVGEDGSRWILWPDAFVSAVADWLADPDTYPPPLVSHKCPTEGWTPERYQGMCIVPADVLARCDSAGIPVPDGMRNALVREKPKGMPRIVAAPGEPISTPRPLTMTTGDIVETIYTTMAGNSDFPPTRDAIERQLHRNAVNHGLLKRGRGVWDETSAWRYIESTVNELKIKAQDEADSR